VLEEYSIWALCAGSFRCTLHSLIQYNYQVFVEMEPNRRRDEDKFQVIDQEERKKYDKRTLVQVFATDLQNIVYFFTPLIVIHNVAC